MDSGHPTICRLQSIERDLIQVYSEDQKELTKGEALVLGVEGKGLGDQRAPREAGGRTIGDAQCLVSIH